MLFLNLLDFFTPHLHKITGLDQEAHRNNASLNRVLLFVMAIALHKLPEGIAAGVGFNSPETSDAWAVTIGIAIQNIPEGAIVSMPMHTAGNSRTRSFLIGSLSGIVEPIGALLIIALASLLTPALPYLLAFAAGAMIYVVVEELIPEASTGHHSNISTIGFAAGFTLMMVLDVVLG